MNISGLINLTTTALDRVRIALAKIPALLLVCTCARRPGFSSIITSAKIYADMDYVQDEFAEVVKEFVCNVVNRIKMNIQDDGVCFVAIPPGGMKFILMGGNVGGPIVLSENPADSRQLPSNNNYIFVWAIIR